MPPAAAAATATLMLPEIKENGGSPRSAGAIRRCFLAAVFSLIFAWCLGFFGLWYSHHVGGPVRNTVWQVVTVPLFMCLSFAYLAIAGRRIDKRRRAGTTAGALPSTVLGAHIGAAPEDELSLIGERETFTVAALSVVGWFIQLMWALSVWIAPVPPSPEPTTLLPGYTMIAQATLIPVSVLFFYRYLEEKARALVAPDF